MLLLSLTGPHKMHYTIFVGLSKLIILINMANLKLLKKAFRILKRNFGAPGNDTISIQMIKKDYAYYEKCMQEEIEKSNFKFHLTCLFCICYADYVKKT